MSKQQNIHNIYVELAPHVYRYVLSLSGNKEISEDIMMSTFERYIQKYENKDIEKPKSLLFRIAHNIYVNKSKRETRSSNLREGQANEFDIPEVDELEAQVISAELKAEVENQLKTLDQEKSQVLILKIWEGLTFREIADILKIKENSAKTIFYRGVKELEMKVTKKNKKTRAFALPILLAGIYQISLSKSLLPSSAVLGSTWGSLAANFNLPISTVSNMNIIHTITAKLGLAAISTKVLVIGAAAVILPVTGAIVGNAVWPSHSTCSVDFTNGVYGAMVLKGDQSCEFTVLRFERDMTGSDDECFTSDNGSIFRTGVGELSPNPAAGKCVQLDIPGFGGVKAGNWVEPVAEAPATPDPLADWEAVEVEECGATIYLPPRVAPYSVPGTPEYEGNEGGIASGYNPTDRRGQFWQITRSSSNSVTLGYLHSPEIVGEYSPFDQSVGYVSFSCIQNDNQYTTQEYVVTLNSSSPVWQVGQPIVKWERTVIPVVDSAVNDATNYFYADQDMIYIINETNSDFHLEVNEHIDEILDNMVF